MRKPLSVPQLRWPVDGRCSGIYFLFRSGALVYVGQGWNCLLRVAEHTRRDGKRFKKFDSWTFLPYAQGKSEKAKRLRKALERAYILEHEPVENRQQKAKRQNR